MRKVVIVILLLASAAVQAQSMLWRVTGKDAARPSYLFGTIHMYCAGQVKLHDSLFPILAKSDKLLIEISEDLSGPASAVDPGMLLMDSGKSVADYLTDSQMVAVKSYLKNAGMPEAYLNYKPFFIMAILQIRAMRCSDMRMMEAILKKQVKNDTSRIGSLESVSDAMGAIGGISMESQARMLYDAVTKVDSTEKAIKEVFAFYNEGNVDKLGAMAEGEEDILNELLLKRNEKWMPVILPNLKKGNVVIAPGAAHLGGKHGLIAILRKAGYTVTPVL